MALEEKTPNAAGRVQMGDVDIHLDRPLPQYNSGPVKAYEAFLRGEYPTPCFALICEKYLSPRIEAVKTYQQITHEGAAQLVKWGPVVWPPAGQERYALIYRHNLGAPLLASGEDKSGLGMKNETVIEAVVRPMASLLAAFRDRDFVHGSIRVENMFSGAAGGRLDRVMLGDCLATPVSFAQPVVYETIHRGMADPVARGRGMQSDDLYSFGVALAVMMRTKDPLKGLTDHEIIKHKIDVGTYAAVTGKDRFTGSILELLRGLLNDDPAERWKLDEVIAWLDGRRLSPKQPWRQKRAARPLAMGGHKYFNSSVLAMDIDKYPSEAVPLIENGELEQWIMRSLDDTTMLERYQKEMISFRDGAKSPSAQDRMLSTVSQIMDPHAPLRYRGAHMMAGGIGPAITEKLVHGQDVKSYNDILSQGIALNWVLAQDNSHMDTSALMSRFDACRSVLRHGKLGYGFERCVYMLDPDAPCLSDKLREYAAYTADDFLLAFESLCKKGKASPMFLDRHSAAFLSVKDRRCIDNYLFDLNAREEHKRLLGELQVFAALQQAAEMPGLPAIAQAFNKRMPILLARFHDRTIHEKMKKSLDEYAVNGNLVKMAQLLTNTEVINKDFYAFREAMREFAGLNIEYETLQRGLKNKRSYGAKNGQDISAVVCAVIAALIAIGIGFVNFTH